MKRSARYLKLAVFIAALAAFALLRLDALPTLLHANAPGEALALAQQQVEQRRTELEAAELATAPLRGERGDFERRGASLPSLPEPQRETAARSLAGDIRLLSELANAAAGYREALAEYDAALMARTRDLGPRGEALRPATWPIVEHLKLYPPPRGQNSDFRPPQAEQIAEWAATIERAAQDDADAAAAAAIALGRSTFSLYQLIELDRQYHAILTDYAALLEAQLAVAQPPSALRTLLAGVAGLALALLLAMALALLTEQSSASSAAPPWALLAAVSAAAFYYLLPGLPAAILGAALVWLAFTRWPATALALIPAAIPFYYRPRRIEELSFTLAESLILLAAAATTTHLLLRRHRPSLRGLLREPIAWGALLILLAALISLTSPLLVEQRVALRELRRTIVEPLIFLALLGLARPPQRALAIGGYIVACGFIAADALVRMALGSGVWAMEGVPRLIGLLPSSTALGIVLGAALAGALARAWPLAGSLRGHPGRLAYTLLALPLGLATLLTFTRGAWLGVAAAVLALLALRRAWRPLALAAAALAAGLGGLSLLSAERFRTMFSLSEGTGAARLEIWAAALRLLRAAPLRGAGLDQFVHQDAQRFAIPQVRLLAIAHPHNVILDLWIQLGLLGLLAALAIALLALWRLARPIIQAPQLARSLPILAPLAILIDLLVHGMLDQALIGADMLLLFWACVAQALAPPGKQPRPESENL